MMQRCPYKINNDDVAQKTLFACWFILKLNAMQENNEKFPSTKEIYYFLKDSGLTWNSFHNACQFLTGGTAEVLVKQYVSYLPENEFNLTSSDILNAFALARFFCFPKEMESIIQDIKNEYGISI